MPWIIVKFENTEEVEAVPMCWFVEKDSTVRYPLYESRSKMRQAIINEEQPQAHWLVYNVSLLRPKPYESFKMATAKASKCCLTSDITESEEVLPQKRVPRKKKYSDSSAPSSDSDLDLPLSVLKDPQQNDSSAKLREKQLTVSETLDSSSSIKFPKKSTNGRDIDSSMLHQNVRSTHQGHSEGHSDFEKEIIKLLTKINRRLCDLEAKYDEMSRNIDFIKGLLETSTPALKNDKEENMDFLKVLPIKTEEDLDTICSILLGEDTYKKMVQFLERMGGKDFKECVRRFMNRVIHDSVASKYSFTGHKGKKSFSSLKLFEAVADAVQNCHNATRKEIEITTAQWLSKAPERLNKRNEKNKEQEAPTAAGEERTYT